MNEPSKTLLVIFGCTGGVGRHVTKQAIQAGYNIHACVRSEIKLRTRLIEIGLSEIDVSNKVSSGHLTIHEGDMRDERYVERCVRVAVPEGVASVIIMNNAGDSALPNNASGSEKYKKNFMLNFVQWADKGISEQSLANPAVHYRFTYVGGAIQRYEKNEDKAGCFIRCILHCCMPKTREQIYDNQAVLYYLIDKFQGTKDWTFFRPPMIQEEVKIQKSSKLVKTHPEGKKLVSCPLKDVPQIDWTSLPYQDVGEWVFVNGIKCNDSSLMGQCPFCRYEQSFDEVAE